MTNEFDFSIAEETLEKILKLKEKTGFAEKTWDEWFNFVFGKLDDSNLRPGIENVFEKNHYKSNYEDWVKYFALNLNDIWDEWSAKELDPSKNENYNSKDNSAIVIGAGPSLEKNHHLELLAKSNYQGSIICTDRTLVPVLKAGITPDKFPKFYVATIDPAEKLKMFYDDDILIKYGSKIKGIFSVLTHPETVGNARKYGIKIHWIHSLFDYNEGKKSFNQISALMVRAKKHNNGLQAIQTGGNVGTSAWFMAWKILKCANVCMIGMNHGWDEDSSWDEILAHSNAPSNIDKNSESFKRLYPKIYNPDFDCYCIQDPTYIYYSNAFKEFIARSPEWVNTINATEGGGIFGERINSSTFNKFLEKFTS